MSKLFMVFGKFNVHFEMDRRKPTKGCRFDPAEGAVAPFHSKQLYLNMFGYNAASTESQNPPNNGGFRRKTR